MNNRLRFLAVCCTTCLFAPATQAGELGRSITVDAFVEPACTVFTGGGLNFGNYTASNLAGSPIDATASFQTTCTTGASFILSVGDGLFASLNGCPAIPDRAMGSLNPDPSLGWDALAFLRYGIYADAERTIPIGCNESNTVLYEGAGSTSITLYGRIPAGQKVPIAQYRDLVLVTITF